MPSYRLRGVLLPDERDAELWITEDGLLSDVPVPGAATVLDGGWVLPGLVDAHCHVGLGPSGAVDLDEAVLQARANRDGGTLLIRDCGSPVDTRPLQAMADLPVIIRSARHISRSRRYGPGVAVELADEAELPAAVAEQAAAGDGWVKLVGDWIDRSVGDLAPVWSDGVLAEAVAAAHAHGARVTAHVFGADALPGLINAGIDCLEHGTALSDDLIAELARRGTALVPTLINIGTFPQIAEAAVAKYPTYAAHMLRLHAGAAGMVRRAVEAGVAVYAGTDAGGGIAHGRIVDEVEALHAAGMPAADALAAASWAARVWLGRPGLEPGAPADLLGYPADPRTDLSVLRAPSLVVLRGRVITPVDRGDAQPGRPTPTRRSSSCRPP